MGNGWPNWEQTKLLQAGLLKGPRAEKAWAEWKGRVHFDQIDHASYKLLPLIARNSELSYDPIYEKCKGVYRRTWAENHVHWKKLLPTFASLQTAGVEKIVLLKGMAMALEYYRDLGARVMGDIDILVPKEQIAIVHKTLSHAHWEQTYSRIDVENPQHLSRWHALNYSHPSKMLLDVHWSFIEENSPPLDSAVWTEIRPHLSFYTPDPTDLLLQACIHGVKPSPVPLIRWVADSMTLLQVAEKKIRWDRLIELAKVCSLAHPLSLSLEYLIQEFEAPIPKKTIAALRAAPAVRLQYLEYRASQRASPHLANWYRFCLNRSLLTRSRQLLSLPHYLKITARLRFYWQIPFFGIYWIFKRCFRKMRSLHSNSQKKHTSPR
jgi:hypothetical protein